MNLLVLYSMPINKDMTNKFGICPSTGHLSVLFPEKEAERTPSNKIFLAIVLQGGAMIEIDGKNHFNIYRDIDISVSKPSGQTNISYRRFAT